MKDQKGLERDLSLLAPLIGRKEAILYRCKVLIVAILVFLTAVLIDQDSLSDPALRSSSIFIAVVVLVVLSLIGARERDRLASLQSARSSLKLRLRIAKGEIDHD
jgi:hypothetical protein